MKAVISNRIYMHVDRNQDAKLRDLLTYKIPTYADPTNPLIMRTYAEYKPGILSLPVGRIDLIPEHYEIVDKRILIPTEFPKFGFELRPSQAEVHDDIDDNALINARVSWGKAQPGHSKIRVLNGWTTMKDIKVGDEIITPANEITIVTNKFAHTNKPIYEIKFQDGRIVEACEDHLWETITDTKITKIITTKDIISNGYFKRKKLYVPLCEPITDTPTKFVVAPYLMGIILGDGGITHGAVMISSADDFIIEQVRELLPKNHILSHVNNYDYRITSNSDGADSNLILNELRRLKLQGTNSSNKFIPDIYKFGSYQDKIALIQGLLDSDGYADKGNKIEYYSISEKLISDFAELIFSMGGQCPVRIKKSPTYTYKNELKTGKDCFVACVQRLPFEIRKNLFSLERKKERVIPGRNDTSRRLRIESVKFKNNQDCWCISLADKNKLYLTDNYVVTHNTFTAMAIAGKLQQKTLVITHTIPLMHQWAKEVKKVYGFESGIVGGGVCNTSAPITVGNVQSLYTRMDSLKKAFGTIIMDEVHHAPAPIFSKIIDRSFARYKIGLSGTLERKDGKHVVIPDYFGKKVYQPPKENCMNPIIHTYDTGIYFPSNADLNWAQKVTKLQDSFSYQELIAALANKYAREGHKVLVVSDRVEFLKIIAASTNAALIVGETKERDLQFTRLENPNCNILCGTQSIFSEGISYDPLSCLIMATPINNMPLLEQLIGRIIRIVPGKPQPIVVDPVLKGFTTEKQFLNRMGLYIREGYRVIQQ